MKKFSDVFDKNYLLKTLTTLLTAIFALGMIFYISFHIADRFDTELSLLNAEEKTVEIALNKEDFSIVNRAGERVVEPGEFILMVGHSSKDEELQKIVFNLV